MRYHELMELAGVKQFQNMTAHQILQYIESQMGRGSITLLGQGASGAAVMIGQNVYKFWMVDSAYTDFVRYCLRNPNNPFLPKFYSSIKRMPAFFVRSNNAPDYVNYIKMEKLAHDDYAMYTQFPVDITFVDGDDEDENYRLRNIRLRDVVDYCEKLTESEIPASVRLKQMLNSGQYRDHKIAELPPAIVQLVDTLYDIYQLGHSFDLHEGNFMVRPDGQVVIVDPICNRDDLVLNRQFAKFDSKLNPSDGKQAQTSKYNQQSKSEDQ